MWGGKKKVWGKLQKGLLGRVWRKTGSYKRWYIAFIASAKLKLIKAGGRRQQIIVASVTATAPFACETWPRFVVSLDLNALRLTGGCQLSESGPLVAPPPPHPKCINYNDIRNDSFGCVISFPIAGMPL